MGWKLSDFELLSEWKCNNISKTARGKHGGKEYFIKQYTNPVHPLTNGSMSEKTYNSQKKNFELFEARRTRINKALRAVSVEGGNIIIPHCEFREENYYVEASLFVPDVIPDDKIEETLAGLGDEERDLLMLTAASALNTVHSQGIIHSDLKLKNVLLAKMPGKGNFIAKIIDFDSSYFMDDIPNQLTGDFCYYSPELETYIEAEDREEREALKATLTPKSDIFSLGIIFHVYLTGEVPEGINLPEYLQKKKDKGRPIYCWDVLREGGILRISDKIKNLKHKLLIADMLEKDYTKRPSAQEVVFRLKSAGPELVVEEPWEEHDIEFTDATLEKMASSKYLKSIRRKEQNGKKGYEIYHSSGRVEFQASSNMVLRGFATKKGKTAKNTVVEETVRTFCEPWPEDNIEWDIDYMKSKGYVGVEQGTNSSGVKGYYLYVEGQEKTFRTKSNLVMLKYAKKK